MGHTDFMLASGRGPRAITEAARGWGGEGRGRNLGMRASQQQDAPLVPPRVHGCGRSRSRGPQAGVTAVFGKREWGAGEERGRQLRGARATQTQLLCSWLPTEARRPDP